MNLIEALKALPEKRILNDPEFKEVYTILKEVFEKGKTTTNQPEVVAFE